MRVIAFIRYTFIAFVIMSTLSLSPAIAATGTAASEGESGLRRVTLYGGLGTASNIEDILKLKWNLDTAYFVSFGVLKELGKASDQFVWEVEGQAGRHFEKHRHYEFDGVLMLRWLDVPWKNYLPSSLAAGEGLSYATRIPEIESDRHRHTARFLNYLLVELEMPVRDSEWSLVIRLHHRSGVFGLFSGVHGGSNFLAVGLRRRF